MSQAQINMTVRHINPKVSIVDFAGELNAFAEPALMEAYNDASNGNVRAIILNFSGLEYMNSSGIGLLVTLLIRVNRQKQKLLTCGLSDHYQHIFELTRLNEAMSMYDTEAEAIAAANAM